jgi:type II secretory pathway pseudopilin PulG
MKPERGFTIVETVVVLFLIGFLFVVFANRFSVALGWKQRSELRAFTNTWEFLQQEAMNRGESYRLILNLDRGSYSVRREVNPPDGAVVQVDLLKNLRTKGEKERREKKDEDQAMNLDEAYKMEDIRQSDSLDKLFYGFLYHDPAGTVELTAPLEFPSLAEEQFLPDGIRFRDVKIADTRYENGRAYIRFSPKGGSDFAVVHVQTADQIFTVFMNPSTGELQTKGGDLDFQWTLGRQAQNVQ